MPWSGNPHIIVQDTIAITELLNITCLRYSPHSRWKMAIPPPVYVSLVMCDLDPFNMLFHIQIYNQ